MMDQVCSTCGAPATCAAIDVRDVTAPGAQWTKYEKKGAAKYGCVAHPVQSYLYDIDDQLIGAMNDPEGRSIPR